MEEELARVEGEADHIRRRALSTEIMVGTDHDFPAILGRLADAGRWQEVKELLACHVEVIDWHQDAADPSSGTVEVMLDEEAGPDGPFTQNETRDAPVIDAGCVTGNGRLPE